MPSIFFAAFSFGGFLISPGGQELRMLPIPNAFGMLVDIHGLLVPYRSRAIHRAARVDADAYEKKCSAAGDLCVPSQRPTLEFMLLAPGQPVPDCQNAEQRK